MTRALFRVGLAAAIVCLTAAAAQAQQSSTTATQTKTFEILAVEGNQLVVRLPEGTRELTVADDFRFDVNGQQLSVQQLKAGMKGTATITTRTTVTPVTVTEVKNGTIVQKTGSSILVRTDEGFKSFNQGDIDKRGVKIMRDGKPALIENLSNGDRLTATIITSKPPRVLTEKEVNATLAASPAPTSGGSAAPVSAAARTSAPPSMAPDAPAEPARRLPKTASTWPLVGLVSVLSLAIGLSLTIRRRTV
jgi:hypothetical protein